VNRIEEQKDVEEEKLEQQEPDWMDVT